MKHPSLKEKAYDMIKEKIMNGDFEPGSRIMEEMLAEEISMSRTPVREAINRLSAEGFINNIPRRGIFFTLVSKDELRDLLEIREELERMAVRKCVGNIDPRDLSALEENIRAFRVALFGQDYKECNRLDSEFHRQIALSTGNTRLIKFLRGVEEFMMIARTYEKKSSPREKNELTLADHVEVLDAIKGKNKDAAIGAIEKNINRMAKNFGI